LKNIRAGTLFPGFPAFIAGLAGELISGILQL
jgi:hypothetical protein